tara:strand:- start:244 stop:426 length:183 start_codon:yes stop_codon:yes gene_type:complete
LGVVVVEVTYLRGLMVVQGVLAAERTQALTLEQGHLIKVLLAAMEQLQITKGVVAAGLES